MTFEIPANANIKVLSISLKTYIGLFADAPFVSSHSVPILKKDAFTVQFFPEFATDGNFMLAPNVPNKVYF